MKELVQSVDNKQLLPFQTVMKSSFNVEMLKLRSQPLSLAWHPMWHIHN